MKFVREYFIHEVTYEYKTKSEQEMHIDHMISKGFTVVPDNQVPVFMQKSLMITYQKRELNNGVRM